MYKKSSRTFKRAGAIVLSLAMAMSTLVIAPDADAAKKPALAAKKGTITAGKSKTVKIKNVTKKKVKKLAVKTSKKAVATVAKAGKGKKTAIKITAKKKGSAKITATVTLKKKVAKKKKFKLTYKVTVKAKTATKTAAPATSAQAGTPVTIAAGSIVRYETGADGKIKIYVTDPATGTVTTYTAADGTTAADIAKGKTITATDASGNAVSLTIPSTGVDDIATGTQAAASTSAPAGQSSEPATETSAPADQTSEPAAETSEPAEETPEVTPAETSAKVAAISMIDPSEYTLTLTLEKATELDLSDTSLSLVGAKNIEMEYKSISADKTQVTYAYVVGAVNSLKPGDGTSNGSYSVSTNSDKLDFTGIEAKTQYDEAIGTTGIKGYVLTTDYSNKDTDDPATTKAQAVKPVASATVTLKEGGSVTTDANGFYSMPANAGSHVLTVSASGYMNNITENVTVNRNHITSQNFNMNYYSVDYAYMKIQVRDSEGNAIKGATVVVKKNGTRITTKDLESASADVTDTGSNSFVKAGDVGIYNKQASYGYKANEGSIDKATNDTGNFLSLSDTYTIEAEKPLSASNLNDVYKKAVKTDVTINKNNYMNVVTITLEKVKELKSLKVAKTYDEDCFEVVGDKASTGTASDPNKAYTTYELFVKDGTKAVPLVGEKDDTLATGVKAPTTVVNSETVADKKSTLDLKTVWDGGSVANQKNITLPTGTYYLVIRGYNKAASTKLSDDSAPDWAVNKSVGRATATTVAAFAVTEGADVSVPVDIHLGIRDKLTTNVGLTAAQQKVETTASTEKAGKDPLLEIENKFAADGKSTPAEKSGTGIETSNKLYCVVGDVKIPVGATAAADLTITAEGTFSNTSEYAQLMPNSKYVIETAQEDGLVATVNKDTLANESYSFTTTDIVNKEETIPAAGRSTITSVAVTAATGDDVVGAVKAADLKLKKVVVKSGNNTVVEAASTAGIAGSNSNASNSGGMATTEKAVFDVTTLTNLQGLAPGKYTVELTLDGYDTIVSKELTFIGLDKVEIITDGKLTKTAVADEEGVKGTIRVVKDDGSEVTPQDGKALVLLKDSAGKIAGEGLISSGAYDIKDGSGQNKIAAGDYTLVVRFSDVSGDQSVYAETYVQKVSIEANKQTEVNVKAAVGGKGWIYAKVTTNKTASIANLSAKAYDAEYVDVTQSSNWVSGTVGTTATESTLTGVYTDNSSASGKYIKIGVAGNNLGGLSKGAYTVKFADSANAYKYTDQTVTVQNTNQEVYEEYDFDRKDETGETTVALTVNTVAKSGAKGMDGSDPNSIAASTMYAIVVRDIDGNGSDQIAIKYGQYKDSDWALAVPSGKTYLVEVYTLTGNLVGTATKEVQDYPTSVDVAISAAAD